MFSQPSGVSLYEGRTRGKRVRYTYSDNDHDDLDKESSHSSTTRSRHSPAAAPTATSNPDQPRFTASGRQIRKPQTGAYGESKINGSGGGGGGSNVPSENGYAYTAAITDEWKGDSQGDDDDEDDADDESEWDDTAFLQDDGEKKSLRIVLKVNSERLSRKASVMGAAVEVDAGGEEDVTMKDVETIANGHGPPGDPEVKDIEVNGVVEEVA